MTKQEAKYYLESHRHGWKMPNEAIDIAIKCIENLDILIDFVVSWSNQDIICDDLYYYDEVSEDSWCSRNCEGFNRECVLKWLEWKRGVKNENV